MNLFIIIASFVLAYIVWRRFKYNKNREVYAIAVFGGSILGMPLLFDQLKVLFPQNDNGLV